MSKIEILVNGNIKIRVPIKLTIQGSRKRLVEYKKSVTIEKESDISNLKLNLARAFHWRQLIDDGTYQNSSQLAEVIKIDRAHIDRIIRLTFLAPELVHQIITNTASSKLNMTQLKKNLPSLWEEQIELFK